MGRRNRIKKPDKKPDEKIKINWKVKPGIESF